MNPNQFVQKWRHNVLKEKSFYQEHFLDLCRLVGHPTPAEYDPSGEVFSFESPTGGGFVDVWKREYFGWEYKGNHKDLESAYDQLLRYREGMRNPPLLVVADASLIRIHTNFTNSVKKTYEIHLEDLLNPQKLDILKAVFFEPARLRTEVTVDQVTEQAAKEFARLADLLRRWGEDPERIAHFLIRLLFCLFAEDIGLLPRDLFTRLVERTRRNSKAFAAQLRQLFAAMATGGWFGEHEIKNFNGGLFDSDEVLELDSEGIDILSGVSGLDWASIEPSILGTLFERSLDPSKRSQLGAHYTSKEDILLIVEPVLMAPLRRNWDKVKQEALSLAVRRDETKDAGARTRRANELAALLNGYADELREIRVLDPACGSGNFLYVALKELLGLWKEVSNLAGELKLPLMMPTSAPHPRQLFGIEINEYAHELAQATIWIGFIQWLNDNGFGKPPEPILKKLDNIQLRDAVLFFSDEGSPKEPNWPDAHVIIGNPPFLGDKRMRSELGDGYVDNLRALYSDRIPGQSDFVCYWFERARKELERRSVIRVGLLATQSIRSGASRTVLERIKDTGDIFYAHSDRPWILEGAAVQVSLIGFDGGEERTRVLDNKEVMDIYPDLTSGVDLTRAVKLEENQGVAYQGTLKVGSFDIHWEQAIRFLSGKGNPNNRPNSDVIKKWINASDVTSRPRNMWIIDFGTNMSLGKAAEYELPFEYVKKEVKPIREKVRRKNHRERWWIFGEARPGMRKALAPLSRYLATPRVAKHRVFVFLDKEVIPDGGLYVFARDDFYFFGVLQSTVHELWSRRQGSQLREASSGSRYTPSSTFETFPFPFPLGKETMSDPRSINIARAAEELYIKRDEWLHPFDMDELEIKSRTLTNLYNKMPTWLQIMHETLDKAVHEAYGWPIMLSDDEILERLLELNLQRAKQQG